MIVLLLCVEIRLCFFNESGVQEHPLVKKAFDIAKVAHDDTVRGTSFGRPVDTMFHPAKVASLLENSLTSYEPELIAAAMVHDVDEDTDVTIAELSRDLGSNVAGLVTEVSVDSNLKGHARREFQIAAVDSMSLNAKRLKGR